MGLLIVAIEIYTFVLIGRMLMSWIPVPPGSPIEPVYRAIYTITEPPLAALRSVVPPLRIGMGALDLSPLILFFALQLLVSFLR